MAYQSGVSLAALSGAHLHQGACTWRVILVARTNICCRQHFLLSAYGARKGVVDTALRTADSGYLTRRLIDVAQDVIIREPDCGTKRSLKIYYKGNKKNSIEKILGRTSAEDIYSKDFNNIIRRPVL